jgi:hypothetical protein
MLRAIQTDAGWFIMEIAGKAAASIVLRLKQSPSRIPQRLFARLF